MERRAIILAALLALLVVSNAAWATLYQLERGKAASLQAQLEEANRQLDLLAKRVAVLEDNNTALHLQIRSLREKLARLADLVESANETLRRALLVSQMLRSLNTSITRLLEMTYPHAFYTPELRSFIRPGQVGDVVMDVLGISVFTPEKAIKHLEMLYNYTASEIEDSPDQPFVAITNVKYVKLGDGKYAYAFDIVKLQNYIQDPIETLLRKAGDCEDKAILLTSMYISYLGSFGDSWVFCFFGQEGYSHCVTVAYVKPLRKYIIADPTLKFFSVEDNLRDGVDHLFAYIGLKWSEVTNAIAFNDRVFEKGDLYTIIDFMEKAAR